MVKSYLICPVCKKEVISKAKHTATCSECGKMFSVKSHFVEQVRQREKREAIERGEIKPEDVKRPGRPPKEKPVEKQSFWDMIKSKREADEDIITTLEKTPKKEEEEFQKELKDSTSPITNTEVNQMIGEAIAITFKQITYMLDEENGEPVTMEEKVSLLSKAAVLCLNIDLTEPDTEPYRLSPITFLIIIAAICFLPQIWNIAKDKFFKKKEEKEEEDESSTPEQISPKNEPNKSN